MSAAIEAKVAVPAVFTAAAGTLGGALYRVSQEFGWTSFTPGQTAALTGLYAAVVGVANVVVAYLAPHTSRPDLYGKDA